MKSHSATLRRLAYEYAELTVLPRYIENVRLHSAVNDRSMIRPVVLIDELPWHEMDFDGSLTPVFADGVLREAEIYFRRALFRHRYFPADMLVPPYYPLKKIIRESGIGIDVEERTLTVDARNHIMAHEYHDQLGDEHSLDRLQAPEVEYDHAATMARMTKLSEAIGDILPIRLTGVEYLYSAVWDHIARYRGVTALLIDLAERPEYTHRMLELLFSFEEARLSQYEKLGLIDPQPVSLHCTCAKVSDLPSGEYDGVKATRKDIWGRGMAQIFASVSPAMHEEFDIQYSQRVIGTCGLSYYGCCEPLDNKIGQVTKLPNLRKIGMTPWADAYSMAEQVSGKYVIAAKSNPAAVAVPILDQENLRRELRVIIEACRNNSCSCDIVLKDISTCHGRPQNIFEWEKVAMEIVRNC